MFCLLLRSEIQNFSVVLRFAVWVLSANGQSTSLSHFSRVIFPYNLVLRATIWQGSTTHGEVALAKRNATLVTKMGIKRLFCMFWICATIFRPYFLDLSIPQIPRKFKELHLFLTPFEKWKKCCLLSTLFFGLHNSNGFTSGALIIFFRSSSCLPFIYF